MSNDSRIYVSLEARVNDFEKRIASAQKRMDKVANSIQRSADRAGKEIGQSFARGSKDAERSLARLGRTGPGHLANIGMGARDAAAGLGALQGALAGGFAIAGVGAMVAKVREATSAVAEMAAQAKVAGLDPQVFQELAFVGKRAKIPVDALTDGLKELQLRGDEFAVTGAGSAAEAFQRLGWGAKDVAAKLADPVGMLDEIISRARMLDTAAQIRVFDELFGGTGGERMVSLLDAGVGSLGDMRREAHEVGAVLDTETIAKAVTLDQRFGDIATTVDTKVKTALIEAGDATFRIVDTLDGAIARLGKYLSDLGNSDVFAKLNTWLAEQGLLSGEGVTILDPNLAEAARVGAIKTQEERVRRLTEGLTAANEIAGLDEAEVGAARIKAARVEAERLAEELLEAHKVLANLRSIPTGVALDLGTINAPPQYGPPMPPSFMDMSDAHKLLDSRRAHSGVNVTRIEATVAQTVASVLTRFPGALVTSGYRSPEGNRGAENSQHLHGNAVDIVWPGASAEQWESLTRAMIAAGARGIGRYGDPSTSAHFDWRSGPRAAWGPNYSRTSLGQTESWFQNLAGQFMGGGASTGTGDDARAREEAARAAERQRLAIQGVISDLEFENQLLGQSTLQQQIATEQRRAGVEATSAEGQKIAELVTARYRHTEAVDAEKEALERQKDEARDAAEAQAQMAQQLSGMFTGAFTGLLSDLMKGKDATEALQNALTKLADQLLSMALNQLFSNLFAGLLSGGGLGGLGLFADGGEVKGFATGGFVSGSGGPRSDSIPAMLSNGEFVINAEATKRFGPILAAINEGRFSGFVNGGTVGSSPTPMLAGGANSGQTVNFAPVINVESKATGDPAADAKAAELMGKAIEERMRHLVVDEVMRQQRSGGILSRRR